MSPIRSVILICVFSASVAMRSFAVEKGARSVDSAWTKAVKSNSVDAVMACYAPDAVGWFPGGAEAKGEKAIRASYEKMFADFTIKDAVLTDTHYKDSGNLSAGWGRFSIMVIAKASGNTNVWSGRFTDVAEKQGGRWVYLADHASAEPGAVPAPSTESKPATRPGEQP
jgi:ketosteroid isomerase-like protein